MIPPPSLAIPHHSARPAGDGSRHRRPTPLCALGHGAFHRLRPLETPRWAREPRFWHRIRPVPHAVGAPPAILRSILTLSVRRPVATAMSDRFDLSIAGADRLDAADPLRTLRDAFELPTRPDGGAVTYMCGQSLGPLPRAARRLVGEELDDWSRLAVEGHFHARRPWVRYEEAFRELTARLVGARPGEVVMMNSLTINIHLLLTSFWRPAGRRTRILMERGAFPSDTHAVRSHVAARGLDPDRVVVEVGPRPGAALIAEEDLLEAIDTAGDTLALVFLGGVQYATGQALDIARITAAAHRAGALAGWDLAHWVGNLPARLHDWEVDCACWCSYKYLNGGPGAVAGAFVHERHGHGDRPRLAGWWGADVATRFAMRPEFAPRAGAEGWSVSTPAVLAMAPAIASLEIFDRVGMAALRAKSLALTGYLRAAIAAVAPPGCRVITPDAAPAHGAQLSVAFDHDARQWHARFMRRGVVCDFREPNIVRLAPAPLYNGWRDAWTAADVLRDSACVAGDRTGGRVAAIDEGMTGGAEPNAVADESAVPSPPRTSPVTRGYDISPPLSPRLAVFPGDTAFTRITTLDIARGDPITLSATTATLHLGAHADAPAHYHRDGPSIDRQPLDLYVGPCQLVRVAAARGRAIAVADVAGRCPSGTERLVLATGTYPDPERWVDDFASLDPALVPWLGARGVRLVVIDTPSVDRPDSKDLPAHAACFRHGIAIIEGVVLDGVPEGHYELIALPLAIEGGDASPVRAILRTLVQQPGPRSP